MTFKYITRNTIPNVTNCPSHRIGYTNPDGSNNTIFYACEFVNHRDSFFKLHASEEELVENTLTLMEQEGFLRWTLEPCKIQVVSFPNSLVDWYAHETETEVYRLVKDTTLHRAVDYYNQFNRLPSGFSFTKPSQSRKLRLADKKRMLGFRGANGGLDFYCKELWFNGDKKTLLKRFLSNFTEGKGTGGVRVETVERRGKPSLAPQPIVLENVFAVLVENYPNHIDYVPKCSYHPVLIDWGRETTLNHELLQEEYILFWFEKLTKCGNAKQKLEAEYEKLGALDRERRRLEDEEQSRKNNDEIKEFFGEGE